MQEFGRPVPKRRLHVVLGVDEVLAVLARLQGEHQLLVRLRYGTGLRITEALCLRVKDIDFAQRGIYVRQGKGGKEWVAMLQHSLASPLRDQLGRLRQVGAAYVESGHAGVAESPGHADMATTMIYTPVLRMGGGPPDFRQDAELPENGSR